MTVRRRSDVEVVDVALVVEGSAVGSALGSIGTVGQAGRAGHRVPEGILHVEVVEVLDGFREGRHARQRHTAR